MASVPNMRLGPAPQPGMPGQAAEGAEADLFAQLLSVLPGAKGAQPLGAPELQIGSEPAEGEEGEGDEAAAILGLVSFEVPAATPQVAPSQGGDAPILAGPVTAPPAAAAEPAAASNLPFPSAGEQALPAAAVQVAGALPAAVRRPITAAAAVGASPNPLAVLAGGPQSDAPAQGQGDKPSVKLERDAAPSAERQPLTEQKIVAMLRGLSSPTGTPQRGRAADAAVSAASTPSDSLVDAAAAPQPVQQPQAAAPVLALQASALQSSAPIDQTAASQPGIADQILEHQLDLAADGEWLDSLARDIVRSGGSEGPMRFRLNPEHLGALRVEVTQGDNGAAIRLTADTEAARAILAEAQPKLLAEARAQGLRVSDAQVDLSGGNAGDPRRHEDGRRDPILRTARSQSSETDLVAQPQRGTSDRYA